MHINIIAKIMSCLFQQCTGTYYKYQNGIVDSVDVEVVSAAAVVVDGSVAAVVVVDDDVVIVVDIVVDVDIVVVDVVGSGVSADLITKFVICIVLCDQRILQFKKGTSRKSTVSRYCPSPTAKSFTNPVIWQRRRPVIYDNSTSSSSTY